MRTEHRGEGLAGRLIAAAIDFAASHGARVLEGYPVDPSEGRKKASNELYRGVVSTFERAGFQEVARPAPDRAVVALELSA
ncbi:hypothetical protein [Agrococcus sp. TSP3-2-1]|uniref:hypothetical protein n=1 Tax=Agrococcus sp. TSP3-2-1 TaxID=2804583 RepID=UPI003CF27CF8